MEKYIIKGGNPLVGEVEIGEAKNADIGIAGGHHEYVIFKKDKVIKKVPEAEALEALIEEINKF